MQMWTWIGIEKPEMLEAELQTRQSTVIIFLREVLKEITISQKKEQRNNLATCNQRRNTHLKKCSVLLTIREVKIKMEYLLFITLAKIKKMSKSI